MADPGGRFLVGIDTGGTFTDLVAYDHALGDDLDLQDAIGAQSAGTGAARCDRRPPDLPMAEIAGLVHGTTVATNALIERTGARVLLLVTAGHEDIPYIQRINRKTLYDLRWQKPKPLLTSRRDSLGVPERIGARDRSSAPLDARRSSRRAGKLRQRPIEAVAICLLFSYVNPDHERRVKAIVARELPGLPISVSHEVAPIWREYERTSTTIADAYLKPLMGRYVGSLTSTLTERRV